MHLGPEYLRATSSIIVLKAGFDIFSGYIEFPVELKFYKPQFISAPNFQS